MTDAEENIKLRAEIKHLLEVISGLRVTVTEMMTDLAEAKEQILQKAKQ